MDGGKERLSESLQFRLSAWLSLAILGVALITGVFAFLSAFDEAHELQDDVLRQVAALFDQYRLPAPQAKAAGRLADTDGDSRVFVRILPKASADEGVGPREAPALPATLRDGFQTVSVGHESLRVFVKTLRSGERVAFAQQTEVRDEIARDSALRALAPFLVLVPILLLLVANLVRKMFRPIAQLAAEADRRGEQDLHPLAAQFLPTEVRPFVTAINRLLERVAQSMQAQRRFVADAAHELRSPLTALSLQAERLADAGMSAPARERLGALRQGIARGRNLLDQLLALARAQSSGAGDPKAPVSVHKVFRRVLEDLVPLAQAKNINIGVVSEADAHIPIDEIDLVAIVKNLADNAIRYTPDGGRVDLSVRTDGSRVILQVDDSGPGIPAGERERVFDPFYRILGNHQAGSGLGLSIVKTIAHRNGAEVKLAYADEAAQSGLRAAVTFLQRDDAAANRDQASGW